jgi:sortase A
MSGRKSQKGASSRGLRFIQYGAATVGVLLVGIWFAAWVHGNVMSRRDLARFETARVARAARVRVEVAPMAQAEEVPGAPVDTSLWADGRIEEYRESLLHDFGVPLAVMRIRKLEIEVPVLPGTDDLTLNRGVGWIEGTAAPGTDGNCAVAGHRDGFFRRLKDIELGDVIEVETLDGSQTYVVDDLTIVDPSNVSVLADRDLPSVTLVTCYPFYFVGSAPRRFIVRASVSSRPPSGPAEESAHQNTELSGIENQKASLNPVISTRPLEGQL